MCKILYIQTHEVGYEKRNEMRKRGYEKRNENEKGRKTKLNTKKCHIVTTTWQKNKAAKINLGALVPWWPFSLRENFSCLNY